MPRVHVSESTHLPPERVLEAARDFSERRAERWPDVHLEHLEIHGTGETFAEVTEGNPSEVGLMWERLRYDWSDPGAVKAVVVDSNLFHPGSTWELHARPANGGSHVEIVAERNVRGLKGHYDGLMIRLGVGKRVVTGHLRHFSGRWRRRTRPAAAIPERARAPPRSGRPRRVVSRRPSRPGP